MRDRVTAAATTTITLITSAAWLYLRTAWLLWRLITARSASIFAAGVGGGIKPVLMEYEKWSREGRPNWMWIKDGIQKSKALFLILTKNIVK